MSERVNRMYNDGDSVNLGFETFEDSKGREFIGKVTDTITYPDGRVEVLTGHNIVVNDISKLLACFVKFHSGYVAGNLYWAVGSGSSNWDTTPYNPVNTNTKLVNEVFRKPITSREFVNSNGDVIQTVSNHLELTVIIDSGEANGHSLREFGIFGGNATGTKDSGIMINHKAHSRIDKVEGMRIERSVRFTF